MDRIKWIAVFLMTAGLTAACEKLGEGGGGTTTLTITPETAQVLGNAIAKGMNQQDGGNVFDALRAAQDEYNASTQAFDDATRGLYNTKADDANAMAKARENLRNAEERMALALGSLKTAKDNGEKALKDLAEAKAERYREWGRQRVAAAEQAVAEANQSLANARAYQAERNAEADRLLKEAGIYEEPTTAAAPAAAKPAKKGPPSVNMRCTIAIVVDSGDYVFTPQCRYAYGPFELPEGLRYRLEDPTVALEGGKPVATGFLVQVDEEGKKRGQRVSFKIPETLPGETSVVLSFSAPVETRGTAEAEDSNAPVPAPAAPATPPAS